MNQQPFLNLCYHTKENLISVRLLRLVFLGFFVFEAQGAGYYQKQPFLIRII